MIKNKRYQMDFLPFEEDEGLIKEHYIKQEEELKKKSNNGNTNINDSIMMMSQSRILSRGETQ